MAEVDNKSTQPKKKRRGMRWKTFMYALLVLLLAFAVFRFVVHQRVQTRLDAIRAAGYPLTLEELDAWYAYPEGPNAADVYQQAFEAFVGDGMFEASLPLLGDILELPKPGEEMPADVAERIAYYLEQNAEAIRLLEEAAKIEDCRYPIDMTEGIYALLPDLGQLRHGARLLVLQSALDAERGHHDKAAGRCLTILSLAGSLDDEPILISALVKISILSSAYTELQRLILSGEISDDVLDTLSDALGSDTTQRNMTRAIVGEMCVGHTIFVEPGDYMDVLHPSEAAMLGLWRLSGVSDLDQGFYLRVLQSYIDVTQSPVWPLPESLSEIYDIHIPFMFSRMLIPALDSAVTAWYLIEAKRRVLLTAIAAEQYRRDHGSLPVKLEDMVPEYLQAVPGDPFADKPLQYRHEQDGAIIYSIGQDGLDNAGRPYDEFGFIGQGTDGTDIAFVYGQSADRLWPIEPWEEDPFDQQTFEHYADMMSSDDPDDMQSMDGSDPDGSLEPDVFSQFDQIDRASSEWLAAYHQKLERDGFPKLLPRNDSDN